MFYGSRSLLHVIASARLVSLSSGITSGIPNAEQPFGRRWLQPLQKLPPCLEDGAISCALEFGEDLGRCHDTSCDDCSRHHACVQDTMILPSGSQKVFKGYRMLLAAAHEDVNYTTWLVFHVHRIFAAAIHTGLPLMARSGFLLGIVRHGGFIPYDRDPDVMIPVQYASDMTRTISHLGYPYKCMFSEDRFVIAYRHLEIMSGIFLYDAIGSDHMTLGNIRLYGMNETQLFYKLYGHSSTETPLYTFHQKYLLPPKVAIFYDRMVLIPTNPHKILQYQYGVDVMEVMYDKTQWIAGQTPQRIDATLFRHITAHIDWNALEALHDR